MSPPGPPNPMGDRQRMADALASLKEGLRDTADPLYDSWKLRARAAPPVPGAESTEAQPARLRRPTPPPVPEVPIDITLDGTPDQTPAAPSAPRIALEMATQIEVEVEVEGSACDAYLTEEAFFNRESLMDLVTAADPVRLSVPADTVRVRVIPYRAFPRWAIVVAAALVVFAASLVVLRFTLPAEILRSTRSVLSSEAAPPTGVERSSPAALEPQIPTADPANPAPARSANPAADPAADPTMPTSAWIAKPAADPGPVAPAATARPTVPENRAAPRVGVPMSDSPAPTAEDQPTSEGVGSPVPPPPGASKIPSTPLRRRPGARDFFRDPGF